MRLRGPADHRETAIYLVPVIEYTIFMLHSCVQARFCHLAPDRVWCTSKCMVVLTCMCVSRTDALKKTMIMALKCYKIVGDCG